MMQLNNSKFQQRFLVAEKLPQLKEAVCTGTQSFPVTRQQNDTGVEINEWM